MGKKKTKGQKKQAIQNLAASVKTPITEKPDTPEPDEAFLAPEKLPTPFENAVAEFDPEGNREFAAKLRKAAEDAEKIANRAEEARQLSAQIDALKSEFLTKEAIDAAKKTASAALKLLDAAATQAGTDRAEMERTFLENLPKAKAAKAPDVSNRDFASPTAKRLNQKMGLRTAQEAELQSSKDAAARISAAWPGADKAAGDVKGALNTLLQAIQAGLNKQAQLAAQAEERRQLEASARQSALKAEQFPLADLLKRAVAAKVPIPNPKLAEVAVAAGEAVKASNWTLAISKSQEFLTATRLLQRALTRALGAEDTYNEESARVFALLAQVRSELARLKIKPLGPFAELKTFEDAAKTAAKAKNWPDAMDGLAELEDRIEQANKIFPKFDRYLTGAPPMLLKATFDKVVALKSLKTNDEILAKLAEVYEKQCDVAAENWRLQLGYYPPFKGSYDDHYSTYWDSIVAASVTVFKRTAGPVLDDLFNGANWSDRIHATYVLNDVHHHKYWGGLYSPSLQINWDNGVAAQHPEVVGALDAQYQTMATHMRARVEDAISKHGRVGNAVAGPAVS